MLIQVHQVMLRLKVVYYITFSDCHDLHLQELHGTANTLPKKLVIYYSDGERKKKNVICKHSDQHTNHQLVDNSINPDPNWPVTPIKQTVAGEREINVDY